MKDNRVLNTLLLLVNEMEIIEDEIKFLIDDEVIKDVVGKSGRVIVMYEDDEARVGVYVDNNEFLTEEDFNKEF